METNSDGHRKIGQGSLAALVRQGHKEIGQVLPAFPGNMHVVEEPGTFNNPTFNEVGLQRGTSHGPNHGPVITADSNQPELQVSDKDWMEMEAELDFDIEL